MSERQRLAVHYDGIEYAILDRSLQSVLDEVNGAVESGQPAWLDVAYGMGRPTAARLLVSGSIPIAVWEVNANDDEAPREPESPHRVP